MYQIEYKITTNKVISNSTLLLLELGKNERKAQRGSLQKSMMYERRRMQEEVIARYRR